MSVSKKVKALLSLKDMKIKDVAEYMGTSQGAFSAKLFRNGFSADDLIKVADCVGVELAFIIDGSRKIAFDPGDIGDDEEEVVAPLVSGLSVVGMENGFSQNGNTNIAINQVGEAPAIPKIKKPKKKLVQKK